MTFELYKFCSLSSAGSGEVPEGLVEQSSTSADQAVAADPWDQSVTLAGSNRFIVDLAHWNGPAASSHVLDPGGTDGAFTGTKSGGGFSCYVATLLDASMPANGTYTDRIDYTVVEDGNRQVFVLSNARQARSVSSVANQPANFSLNITRSGGGDFPEGSRVYVVGINDSANAITASGHATNFRAGTSNTSGGARFVIATGVLESATATVTVSFSAAAWGSNGEAAGVVVEPV